MADLGQLRTLAAQTRDERAGIDQQLAGLQDEMAAARLQLTAARAVGDAAGTAAAAARVTELAEARRAPTATIADLHDRFAAGVLELLGDEVDLEGDVPLVLLPVRVEVRSTPDQAALRVRVFHDAIHAEALDEGVDPAERDAAVAYWTAVWPDGDPQAPWPALVAAVGARRAPWVAEALRPTNLADRPGADPVFPEPPPRAQRTAVARTLPDRFFVRVEQDGADPQTVHGSAIPDELPVGLADQSALVALQLDGQDLPPIDESLRWLADYAEAERVGMAVTVPLPVAGQAVRKLVVYGVRAALEPADGAARLDRLVRAHRFTDGAELLAQGTPTNNTDSARTDWSRRTPPGPPELTGAADLDAGANGAVVAAALGLDPALLATLPGARDGEQARAAAFNTALWATTWGDAIEHLTPAGRANGDQRLDNPSLDAVRDHWVDHVRGRGPLPALRLGRQPYGLLPIVATDASWRPLADGFVEDRLVPFIDQQLRWMWEDAVASVPTVARGPLDTVLPEILGTDAVLRSLRVRTALSPDPVLQTAMALTLPDLGDHPAQQQVTHALLVLAGVDPGALGDHDLLGAKTRALGLPLVHESDNAFVANLLEDAPRALPHASVLQVLLAHAAAVERHGRDTLLPPEARGSLKEAIGSANVEIDRDLTVRALESVVGGRGLDDPAVGEAADMMNKTVGRLDAHAVADRHPVAALAPPTLTERVAGAPPDFATLRSNAGMQFLGEVFQTHRWGARFRDALKAIASIDSLDERRLLLGETLDCCSHRLDAWITAAATRRLGDLRAGGAAGAFIGAYGVLEDIALRTPQAAGQVEGADVLHDGADGGFVHAPGLLQAATAGVLRSGRLTHRRGDPNADALEIDLSSTRVRDALALLEGMRNGQALGALLGYRLERRLHERSGGALELDRFIYVLRTLAPLRAGKLTDPGQPPQEGLAASDVVDGLKLMEIPWATVAAKLVSGPDDQTYITPPDVWNPPRAGEAEAVRAAIEALQDTHDAVADLLLAEAVHQVVVGNPARAAATMDVLGAGEAPPPEPEVVRTPRTGIAIQHRVAIVAPAGAAGPAVPGWDGAAPRALAEPRLEAWARGVLGDPAALPIASDHLQTIADAGLCALDVLYDADGDGVETSTLAARLRRRIGPFTGALDRLAPTWELAGLLRARIAGARALDVADVGRPVTEDAIGRSVDGAEIVARADAANQALKTAAAAAAGTDAIEALAPFGIRPQAASPTLDLTADEQAAALAALGAEAARRSAEADLLLARATPPAPGPAPAPRAVAALAAQALTAVFGTGFVAVPVVGAAPAGEGDLWDDAVGPGGVTARPGADIRPWLARAGTLRAATAAYGETLLVRDAFRRPVALRVVQTPAAAFGTWAGLPFPDARPPVVPLQSMVAEVVGGAAADLSGAVAGVVLDEWTEIVPKRLERGDPAHPEAAPELVDVTTTGVALNANAPGARPPQAVLVALSPDGGAWTGDRLVAVVDEALALAKLRCVTLDRLPYAGRYLPALYFHDWSLQGEPVVDWFKASERLESPAITAFLKVEQ